MVIQVCKECGKEFNIQPAKIEKGAGKYCSKECYEKNRNHMVDTVCPICGNTFKPHPSNFKKGYGKFCSPECYRKSPEYANRKTRLTTYKFTCKRCGKEFERTGKTKHRNKYCSLECWHNTNVGSGSARYTKVKVYCNECGKEMLRSPAYIREGWGNFCSYECKGIWMSKNKSLENHPQWQGGISFEPYCPLFNESFKERVRAYFDNKCVTCGNTPQNEELHVHHVAYNKTACCDDTPKMFVVLCRSCHTKTNHNREHYEKLFAELIQTKYHGRSYFTMEEWALLNPQTLLPIPSHTQSPA